MLIHSDGFDSFADGDTNLTVGNPGWLSLTGSLAVAATSGKFNGNALVRPAATAGAYSFSHAGNTKGVAFYFRIASGAGSFETGLLSNAGFDLVTVDEGGYIRIYDGGGTLRVTSGNLAQGRDEFHWLSVGHDSAVGYTIAIDGITQPGFSGATTTWGSTLRVGGSAPANTPETRFDDIVAWDEAGSYFNAFPVAPRRIQLLRPSADGASTQWVPASGSNYAAVDDTDWTGGVGVTAEAAGLKDLYELTDLAVNSAIIDAVVVRTRTENTGDNPANLLHSVRGTDSSEALANPQPVSMSGPTVLQSVFYRDSNNAPWSASSVNAVQVGQTSSN